MREIIEAMILITRQINRFIWFERLHVACGLFAKLFLLLAIKKAHVTFFRFPTDSIFDAIQRQNTANECFLGAIFSFLKNV